MRSPGPLLPLLIALICLAPPAFPGLASQEKAKPAAGKPKSQKEIEAEALYKVGEDSFRKGQKAAQGKLPGVNPRPHLQEAVKAFRDLIKTYPHAEKTPQGAYFLGSSYLLLDEPQKALSVYRDIFQRYPGYKNRVWSLYRIGICQSALDQPRQARVTYTRLIREFRNQKNHEDEVKKANRSLQELALVGRPAPRVSAARWLYGVAEGEGLATFRGEVVVLIFFATWCKNCEKELPHLRSLMRNLSNRGVVFIGVANPNDPKNDEEVQPYIDQRQLEFLDVALDPSEASWVPYRVRSFPAAVAIDKQGRVRWRGHPAFLVRPLLDRLMAE